MENRISSRYKNSYKDEYEALIEAVFEGTTIEPEEEPRFTPREILYDDDGRSFFDVQHDLQIFDQANVNESENFEESLWSELPDLLLENVFSLLSMQQRYYASLVCKSWHRVFYLPNAWRTFVFDDKTLTRRLFNYYSGWQVISRRKIIY